MLKKMPADDKSPLYFVHSDGYADYDFGPLHPLKQVRVRLFRELVDNLNLLNGRTMIHSPPPDILLDKPAFSELNAKIELVHDREYVGFIKRMDDSGGIDSMNEGRIFGFAPGDNPVFKGMYSSSALHVNGTLHCCDLVMNGYTRRAFSTGGGFHHALARKASGFCIFNDVAIAAKYLISHYGLSRVMYIDIDAHHSDGVQWLLYSEPRVLKVSIHQDPATLFPWTGYVDEIGEGKGRGYCANIPVPPGTHDEAYLYAFREIIPWLVKAYKPQVILAQMGADTHFSDPLTQLRLTTACYKEISKEYESILKMNKELKFIGVTGGGYRPTSTAKSWLVMLSRIAGYTLPEKLPDMWLKSCIQATGERPDDRVIDSDPEPLEANTRKTIYDTVRTTVDKLKSNLADTFP